MVYAYKVAGARAAEGALAGRSHAAAQKAADACRSIGVALTPCIVPESGKPSFAIGDGEIEFGMGIHGEPGIWRGPLKSADALVDEMLERLLPELDLGARQPRGGAGQQPRRDAARRALHPVPPGGARPSRTRGVTPVMPLVGRYATSMEMAGASLTLMPLDGELERAAEGARPLPVLEGLMSPSPPSSMPPPACSAHALVRCARSRGAGTECARRAASAMATWARRCPSARPTCATSCRADRRPWGDVESLRPGLRPASGSSFGTLLAVGFLKPPNGGDAQALDRDDAGRAAHGPSSRRSRSAAAPRWATRPCSTALMFIARALQRVRAEAGAAALKEAAHAGRTLALDACRAQPNRIGRARMFAEHSIGLDDPGMVAVQRMVEAL